MASLTKGGSTYTYAYDMNGVRSSKTVNGVKHNYITQNGKVVREEYGTTVLEFVYDTNGAPYALRYRPNGGSWQTYYYVLNLQGDVVALLNETGTVSAEYTYDAWGEIFSATNPSSSTVNIQDINPLRYRGYYYDTETGWYYLQSRYYDPVVKRFINADDYASTGQSILGYNMFAYCGNNPVSRYDNNGEFWNVIIGAVVGAVAGAVTQVISNAIAGNNLTDGVASAAIVGAASGAIAATGLGTIAQAGVTALACGTGDAVQQGIDKGWDNIDPIQVAKTTIVGGATSLIGSYAGKKFFGGIEDAGNSLISKGHQKASTGVLRALNGKSHSRESLI